MSGLELTLFVLIALGITISLVRPKWIGGFLIWVPRGPMFFGIISSTEEQIAANSFMLIVLVIMSFGSSQAHPFPGCLGRCSGKPRPRCIEVRRDAAAQNYRVVHQVGCIGKSEVDSHSSEWACFVPAA